MMFKMCFSDVKWDCEEAPCILIFNDVKSGGRLSVEIPDAIGFDLKMLLDQKLDGLDPYFGINDLIEQIGGKIVKLMVRDIQKPGTASMLLDVAGTVKEVELFFADVVSIAIVADMPIYFDESVCQKRELPLDVRLLLTRTSSITGYSFETDL